jgi:hypothetical protein
MVVTLGGGTVTNAACGGVSTGTPDAVSTSAGLSTYIFSFSLGAAANPRTCTITTSGASFQFREFAVGSVVGLSSGLVGTHSGNPAGTFALNYTKNRLIVTGSACSTGTYASTSGVSTPTAASPTTMTIASSVDAGGIFKFGMFTAPFSSSIFSVAPGCNSSAAAAMYNFLLKRDFDPASNDNNPMWLEKAA